MSAPLELGTGAYPGAWAQVRCTPEGERVGWQQLQTLIGEAMGGAELWRASDGQVYYVRPGDVQVLRVGEALPAWRRVLLRVRLWLAHSALRVLGRA